MELPQQAGRIFNIFNEKDLDRITLVCHVTGHYGISST